MSHPDNTLRALKDEPLFVERWQCKLNWHRWTKWSEPGHISSSLYVQQQRTCVDCAKAEIRNVKGMA